MDLVDFLDHAGLEDKKEEIEEAEAKVESQERTVAYLNQQLNEDLSNQHQARIDNDQKAEKKFERLAERRKENLRREKEALHDIRADRDEAKGRVLNLLRDALDELDQTD